MSCPDCESSDVKWVRAAIYKCGKCGREIGWGEFDPPLTIIPGDSTFAVDFIAVSTK